MQDYNQWVRKLTKKHIDTVPIQTLINYFVSVCEKDASLDVWWFYLLAEQIMLRFYQAGKFTYTDTVTAPTKNGDTLILSLCSAGALLDVQYQSGEFKHLITANIKATQETDILRHIVTANNIHVGYAAPIAQLTDMLFALSPNDAIGFENGSLLICTKRTQTQTTVRICDAHNYFSFDQYVAEQDRQLYVVDFANTKERINALNQIYTHIRSKSGRIHPLVYADSITTGTHFMDILQQSLAINDSVVIQNTNLIAQNYKGSVRWVYNKASVDNDLALQYLTYLRKKPISVQIKRASDTSFDHAVNEFNFYEQIEQHLSQMDYAGIYRIVMNFCREYGQSVSVKIRGFVLDSAFRANSVEYICSMQPDRPHFIKTVYNDLDFTIIESMREINCLAFTTELQERYRLNLDFWEKSHSKDITVSEPSKAVCQIISPFTVNDIAECSQPMRDLISFYWGGMER